MSEEDKLKIQVSLKKLEMKHNIQLLMACESGSTSWGYPSKNSDTDVRFIYASKTPEVYSSLWDQKEDIQYSGEGLDFVGYDIRKVFRLMSSSNPTVLEWLLSTHSFIEEHHVISQIRSCLSMYSPQKLFNHYRHFYHRNIQKILDNRESPTNKTLLLVWRATLAAIWMMQNGWEIPPLSISSLLRTDRDFISPQTKEFISILIDERKKGTEKAVPSNLHVHTEKLAQLRDILRVVAEIVPEREISKAEIDNKFQEVLKELFK